MSGSTSRSSGSRTSPTSHILSIVPSPTPPKSSPSLTPKALLQRHQLPVAVQLQTPTPAPSGLDARRPLLLYRVSHTNKIRAESLRAASDGTYATVGPPLVVPDTYTGWFSVVRGSGTSATSYTSVAQVVRSRTTTFLTRYDLPAIVQQPEGGGNASHRKTTVKAGEVLKLVAVTSHGKDEGRFAQCINYQNQVVLVSLNAAGKFYSTAEKTGYDTDKVYLISQLLKAFQLPLTVKLVCGYMPRTPCAFTGILRLLRCQKESVLLACTMTSRAEATLLEMDLNSNFLLSPILDPVFCKSPIYLKTLSYCDDEANEWQRQIKVTHHVAEQRSRSLTRSFSDKFVDGPLLGTSHGPRTMSSFCTLDRVKPRRSVADNSIGRLANKVMKIKERKKEETCKDNDSLNQSFEQVVYPRTKLFEKPRSLSKQNTYVQDINRRNRPLPDPTTKSNKLNIKYSLNSLKRTKKIKNRPLPTPTELVVETPEDCQTNSTAYKFVKTSKDGIEYCRVLDEPNPLPSPFSPNDSDNEKEEGEADAGTENLYSEIDDFPVNEGVDGDFSDEERDSASYSNGNSSNESSIDTKVSRDDQMFLKFRESVSRNLEVKAMVHSEKSSKSDDQFESDHYATLTLNEDDDGSDNDSVEQCHLNNVGIHHYTDEKVSEKSVKSMSFRGDLCDSLKNLSTVFQDNDLKKFIDKKGTIREKYTMRQRRHNIYETLEEVRENVALHFGVENETGDICITTDNERETDTVQHRLNPSEKSEHTNPTNTSTVQVENQEKTESTEKNNLSHNSSVTFIAADCSEEQSDACATKESSDSPKIKVCEKPKLELTSAYSIADLCSAGDEEDYGIQVRGNTILIKVSDESPKDPSSDAETEKPLDLKSNLKKCSSVSSINILLDENDEHFVYSNEKEDERSSQMVTIEESCDSTENYNEISYCNEACVSISIIDGPEKMTTAKISDDIVNEMYGHQTEETYKSIGVLSPNNELLINTEEVHFNDQPASDLDRKSLDSGNASDDVEDHEDSFDADSLAEDSVEPHPEEDACEAPEEDVIEELESGNGDAFDALEDYDPEDINELYEYGYDELGRELEEEMEQLPILMSKYEISVMEPIMEEDSYESEPSESVPNSPGRHLYQNTSVSASEKTNSLIDFKSLVQSSENGKSNSRIIKENQYENMDSLTPAETFTSEQTLKLKNPEFCRSSSKSVEALDLEHPFLVAEAVGQNVQRTCMTMPRLFSSKFSNSQTNKNASNSDDYSGPLYQNVRRSQEPSTSVYENVSPVPSLCTSAGIYANTDLPSPEHRTVTSFSYISLSPRSASAEEALKKDNPNQAQNVGAELPRESLKSFYNSPFMESPRNDERNQNIDAVELTKEEYVEDSKTCLGSEIDASVVSSLRNDSSGTSSPDGSSPDPSNPLLDFRKVSSLSSDSGCLSGDDSDSQMVEHRCVIGQS